MTHPVTRERFSAQLGELLLEFRELPLADTIDEIEMALDALRDDLAGDAGDIEDGL